MASKYKIGRRYVSWVGKGSLLMMGMLMLVLFFPVVTGGAEALTNTTSIAKTRAVVNAAATVSVALDSEVDIEITPTTEGAFGLAKANLKVATNNPAGYAIYLNTLDATNAMTNDTSSLMGEIGAVASKRVAQDFDNNTWGFALTQTAATAATEYQAVPLKSAEVLRTSELTKEDSYDLTFGAKVDGVLPAGQYSNSVMVSVVANPLQITNLSQLIYMQDMTAGICAETPVETTKQLIDVRDGKEYWVAKLADNNCWMTQNLALDLLAGEKLTSADSDVTSDWVVPTGTESEIPALEEHPSVVGIRSWNFGEYLLVRPEENVDCEFTSLSTVQNCADLVDVALWKPTWIAQDLTVDGKTKYMTVNQAAKTYDAHFLMGNYYQWNTATAGSGNELVSTGAAQDVSKLVDAENSICPKGWELPRGGSNLLTGQPFARVDSVYDLLRAYGYPETGQYRQNNINHLGYTPVLYGAKQDVVRAPIHWVRAGIVAAQFGKWMNFYSGQFWSATAYPEQDPFGEMSALRSFYMTLDVRNDSNGGNWIVTNYAHRAIGLSVRCLAR